MEGRRVRFREDVKDGIRGHRGYIFLRLAFRMEEGQLLELKRAGKHSSLELPERTSQMAL